MSLLLEAQPIPLQTDEHGEVRVMGTRISLDLVVAAFSEGATAEEIVLRYTTLSLPDVYAVISYYLHHRDEVDAYLQRRRAEFEEAKREDEARWSPAGIREMLLARRAKR